MSKGNEELWQLFPLAPDGRFFVYAWLTRPGVVCPDAPENRRRILRKALQKREGVPYYYGKAPTVDSQFNSTTFLL